MVMVFQEVKQDQDEEEEKAEEDVEDTEEEHMIQMMNAAILAKANQSKSRRIAESDSRFAEGKSVYMLCMINIYTI
jgi:uncharacterized membrane protein